jgi:hypothetical protein
VVLDVEDLVTDQAAVQPDRLGPRRAHRDQVVDRPLVDAGDATPLAGLGSGTARLTETILLTPSNLTARATSPRRNFSERSPFRQRW